MTFKKIDITEIEGFRLGNAEDRAGGTGVTTIICEQGAVGGVDVRGGGPATRETDLLRSENTVQAVNAVVLSGGSAFGLEAASGVMDYLSEKKVGFEMFDCYVPIVCGASLFDLPVGNPQVRPDKAMGYAAADNAYMGIFDHGNHGAGTGASVGKYYGMTRAMKCGLGTYACSDGQLHVGAVAAVNALGDVYNGANSIIAGLISADGKRIDGTIKCMKNDIIPDDERTLTAEDVLTATEMDKGYGVTMNTTISCLITNAILTKPEANKLASILHDGYARAIKPVHGTTDGDTIFVLSTCEQKVNFDAFAALATDIIQYSIIDAALSADEAYELPSASSFHNNIRR